MSTAAVATAHQLDGIVPSHGSSYLTGLTANDEESRRSQTQHDMLIVIMGAKYPPKMKNVLESTTYGEKRVLDIGSRSGEWIRDVATDFPFAECIAMDLVPSVSGQNDPSNLKNELHDVNLGLQHCYGKFDVVHCRLISSGVKDYRLLIEEIQKTLRPGGLIELADVDWYVYDKNRSRVEASLDGVIGPPFCAGFFSHMRRALQASGADCAAASYFWVWLTEHPAFESIESRDVWLPCIPGDDAQYPQEAYKLMRKNIQGFVRSGEPRLREAGMSEHEYVNLKEGTLKELHESTEPQFTRLQCIWALKRLDDGV